MFFSREPKPIIEFLCAPEDRGVIAEPVPARTVLPDWFRKLPAVDANVTSANNNGLTIKRCMPFLDAMTTGYMLPLAATVRLEIRENGTRVDAGWEFDKVMVSNHGSHQIAGHPLGNRPPMKFHNYWTIRTPAGWSCLFMPALNRYGLPVEMIAGVVDTDQYASHIHFPFIAIAPDGLYTLEKGAPLIQVIPFRRDGANMDVRVAVETTDDAAERRRILRNTLAGEGWYRKVARAKR